MKKTYFAPEATIVKISTIGMLASSPTMDLNESPSGEQGNPGNSLSREGRGFFDE